MSPEALSARELTRRLVATAANGAARDVGALPAELAWERACRALSRSLGRVGFHALLTRSLGQAQARHPLLSDVRIGRESEPMIHGLGQAVEVHGAPAVTAGLEAVLDAMFSQLGRLIGVDMVARLVESNPPFGTQDDEEAQ